MYYTYAIESVLEPGRFYVGHSTDLRQRLIDHNEGKCPHTAKARPWKVRFYAAFPTVELAQAFEAYLKSGSGHAFRHKHLGF
jgi:predicted GIY-YIG superfamily endonuclease